MAKQLSKAQILTAGDIGSLSTSLLNKSFVHSLPTQLLLRAHNRVELSHLENPRDKRLQIAHTNLFLEMELRDIDHFDTDPNFFTPSNTKWPFDFEPDEVERVEKFRKKIRTINNSKPGGSKIKKQRFQRLTGRRTRIRRGSRRLFKEDTNLIDPQPSKKTERKDLDRIYGLGRHSGVVDFDLRLISNDKTHRVFKEQAVRTWNFQPDSGNIPIANGPRPKKEHWFKTFFPPLGAYQAFMQKTLSAFYRRQTPPWAIQEWDIELTVTNAAGSDTIEKRNFIQAFVDPN